MTALIFLLLFLCIAGNLPIFASLGIVAFAVFHFFTAIPLDILPQRMFAGVEGMALQSIPFFILAANIMSEGGVTSRLIAFANTLVGHLHGGLAICTVLSCLFFAAITGSTASTVVAVGGILYPALVQAGYGERFSLGLVTCSALLGMIIPPSNAMIIYGSISKVSVGALFMSGFGAGLVFVLLYSLRCYWYARRRNIPLAPRAGIRDILKAARDSAWGLGVPVIILGGIYSGVFTPTESAAVAVAYTLFVTLVVYRSLTLAAVWNIAVSTALTSARILIMVAAATLFSWLLTVQGITQHLVAPIIALAPPPWAVLLFANLVMLLAGMFIDVFSNILIFCPLFFPLIAGAGVSELHFGIIASVNADMGNITPPFGLNLFIAGGAFNKTYIETVRAVLPWLLIAMAALAVVTYVPQVSLWLPSQLYLGVH